MFGVNFEGVNFEAGKILADEEIDAALDKGGNIMRNGIAKRIIDYDSNYKLKKYSKSGAERATLALYIFSKECDDPGYSELEAAVKNYAERKGLNANFAKIDNSLKRRNGQLYWDP